MEKSLVILLFVAASVREILAATFPEHIGRCKQSDPELDSCLLKNINTAIHSFPNGNKQLGIPVLDPFIIPRLVIGEGTGPVNVVQNFSNVELIGMTTGVVTVVKNSLPNKIYLESITAKNELLADYNMNGRILILPVKGEGRCNITLINARLKHEVIGEQITKKGKTYWKVTEYNVDIQPDRMYYKFENLFDGDQRLGDEINKVLNENWNEVFADVKKGYEKSFGIIYLNLANSLFSRIPYDEIFLK